MTVLSFPLFGVLACQHCFYIVVIAYPRAVVPGSNLNCGFKTLMYIFLRMSDDYDPTVMDDETRKKIMRKVWIQVQEEEAQEEIITLSSSSSDQLQAARLKEYTALKKGKKTPKKQQVQEEEAQEEIITLSSSSSDQLQAARLKEYTALKKGKKTPKKQQVQEEEAQEEIITLSSTSASSSSDQLQAARLKECTALKKGKKTPNKQSQGESDAICCPPKKRVVLQWTADDIATMLKLRFAAKRQKLFSDPKTPDTTIWRSIADEYNASEPDVRREFKPIKDKFGSLKQEYYSVRKDLPTSGGDSDAIEKK